MSIHSDSVNCEQYDSEEYEEFVNAFVYKVNHRWKKFEKRILKYTEQLTGLKWKKESIPCYIIKISTFLPISCPLTIPIQLQTGKSTFTLSVGRFIDILVHELLHILFMQNNSCKDYFTYLINEKYKAESWNTAAHVPIHAIHKKILFKFFGKNRFLREIRDAAHYPDYKRSWEIVDETGEDSIIEELRSYLGVPIEKQ